MPQRNELGDRPLVFVSEKQKLLFQELQKLGRLTFAMELDGVDAHIMGTFAVNHHTLYGEEDRLDLNGNETHIHIEWNRVHACALDTMENEGVITFFEDDRILFKIFCLAGPFPESIRPLTGNFL
jgi:hypothetical protein